jgi:hypothetical protein
MWNHNKAALWVTQEDFAQTRIMKDAGGKGATLKLAKCKLDFMSNIKSHSGLANSEKHLKQMESRALLMASLAEINRETKLADDMKKKEHSDARKRNAPSAATKFKESGRDPKKVTKFDISSLLLVYFSINMSDKGSAKKDELF